MTSHGEGNIGGEIAYEREMIRLIRRIGEPISIFYEPRNEEMEWMVGLVRLPVVHGHFATPNEGLEWLAKNKDRFDEIAELCG